jgi:hypothetical protein
MFNLKKIITVEQIHKKFDDAENKLIYQWEKILNQNNIFTKTNLKRKAKLLKEIGFVNSKTVEEKEKLYEVIQRYKIRELNKKKLDIYDTIINLK